MAEGITIQKRSNTRHDELLIIYQENAKELAAFIERGGSRGRKKLVEKHQLLVKGIEGPCVLRSLAYFDVGSSFLVDSLHNVYLGAFVSIIFLFST